MGNDFRNYFSEKIVVKIFVVCKGLKWNIPPSLKASSMYHLFDVHTFLNLTKRVCVLSTYLHSLLNNVWYVSVPNLIPLRRPSGVSLLLLSNCRAFKSLIVIHLNIALQWENTTDHWIQILQYYFKDWWAESRKLVNLAIHLSFTSACNLLMIEHKKYCFALVMTLHSHMLWLQGFAHSPLQYKMNRLHSECKITADLSIIPRCLSKPRRSVTFFGSNMPLIGVIHSLKLLC